MKLSSDNMVEAAQLHLALHVVQAVSNDLITIKLSIRGEDIVVLSGEKSFGKTTVSWRTQYFHNTNWLRSKATIEPTRIFLTGWHLIIDESSLELDCICDTSSWSFLDLTMLL